MAGLSASKEWNKVFKKRHLETLFDQKIKGRASVGLDWITVGQFEDNLDSNIDIILRKCNAETYHFTRYREILLSKGAKKAPRCISIPTIRDKLVFSALNEILTKVYGTSTATPMPQVIIKEIAEALGNPIYNTFIKTDIQSFYASVDHEILLKQLNRKVRKSSIRTLIKQALCTSTGQPNTLRTTDTRTKGIPEGLSISNILANIYMRPIDNKYTAMTECAFWRYVDDILIFTTEEYASQLKNCLISDASELSLTLSEEKTVLGSIQEGFEYLGYCISENKVSVRQSSIIKLERTLETIFRSYHNAQVPNAEYLQWKINLKITGFVLDNHKYGWIFFYSQISDLSSLSRLDWLICVFCKRFSIEGIRFKSFMKAYHEITKALHTTTYIPNLDQMTIEEKRHIVRDVYNENPKDDDDAFIEMRFKRLMSKEIRDIQKDVQSFS